MACPSEFGSNTHALEEVAALKRAAATPDSLHVLKGITSHVMDSVKAALAPAKRAVLDSRRDKLHKGATVMSGHHKRLELASIPMLLDGLGLGELQEAIECLALATTTCFRVPYATWHSYRHHVVLATAGHMFKFAVLLERCVPVTKMTKKGEMSRALYGVFFHHCVTHFPQLLKRWCPICTLCANGWKCYGVQCAD